MTRVFVKPQNQTEKIKISSRAAKLAIDRCNSYIGWKHVISTNANHSLLDSSLNGHKNHVSRLSIDAGNIKYMSLVDRKIFLKGFFPWNKSFNTPSEGETLSLG